MKASIILILSFLVSGLSFAASVQSQPSFYAYTVENLNKIHAKGEATPSGPMASISAVTALGYRVTDIEFVENSDYSCSIKVTMSSDELNYVYILNKKDADTKSKAFQEELKRCVVNAKK